MQDIISPVSVDLLKAELTPERKLRDTNKAGNEIYIFKGPDCPNLLREVGRLREIAFRNEGGGSGLEIDLDEFDTMESPYSQLIVWDPEAEAVLGGYRYILGDEIRFNDNGQPILATAHMFRFSEQFIRDYLPFTIELGRSFVAPPYQSSKAGAKALFALDNLWDGLGALMINHSGMKYFFGKMTMYPSFDRMGRDMILYFLKKYFMDCESLVTPYTPLVMEYAEEELAPIFSGNSFKEDYKILHGRIHGLGYAIPPLVNSYMKLSATMKVFGTAINDTFSDVEETGILINSDEMYEEKVARHFNSYIKWVVAKIRMRFPHLKELAQEDLEKILTEKVSLRRKKRQDNVRRKNVPIMRVMEVK